MRPPQLAVAVNRCANYMSSLSGRAHKPLIKFIGARLPRPHYDRSALPPLIIESSSSSSSAQGSSRLPAQPSITVKSKVPRGQGIEDSQLPAALRRKPISEKECRAINNGGAYGLEDFETATTA